MRVERVALERFRSYDRFELDSLGRLTVIVGPNAAGKTNLIEGIQLVTALSSFRHPVISELVKEGEENGRVEAEFSDGNRLLDIELTLSAGKRLYALNGKPKRPAALKGVMPAVSFSPDDLSIVKGGEAARRRLLDDMGDQLSPRYYRVRRDYERIVRQKNSLLKNEASDDLLEASTEMLIQVGARLSAYRAALVARLSPLVEKRYRDLSPSESLTVTYVPSWLRDGEEGLRSGERLERSEAAASLSAVMAARRDEERSRRRSIVGPHADGLAMEIDGKTARSFASQGQQRSIVLALKLGEVDLVEEMLSVKPILLLDDVMSELDGARRDALSTMLLSDMQSFVTTTNLSYFSDGVLSSADVVVLPEGKRSR